MDTKLLVVDDDSNICEILRIYFENEGYQVKCANDGVEGVSLFKIFEPDPIPEEELVVETNRRTFTLNVDNGVFVIDEAPWLLKILETVDPEDYESLQYFQRTLQQSGIIQALVNAGVEDGDIVRVYDIEFEFVS